MDVIYAVATGVAALALIGSVLADRARVRNPVLLGVTVLCGYLWLLARAGTPGWELGVLALTLSGVLAAALVVPVALVVNGVLMWRRERRRWGNLLSLLVGVLLCALLLAVPTVPLVGSGALALLLAGVVLAIAYLGYAAVCLLVYSWFYRAFTRTLHPAAIVVLGAGLRGTRPSPLLARRLDRARTVWAREREHGRDALLVVSGGQGPDEVVSESTAMADWLVEHGVPRAATLEEDRSRNTEQNLRFSGALLAERGAPAPVVAVTSEYHVLRAALLARRLGLAIDVVGSPTAPYYRPSAYLRELAGILDQHRWVHLTVLGVLFIAPTVLAVATG